MLLLNPENHLENTLVLGWVVVSGVGVVSWVGVVGLVVVSLIGWRELCIGRIVPSLVLGREV